MKTGNLRILVTGGAGFIGSHIVDLFVKKGWQVAVVDDLSSGKKEFVHKKASFFHEDINSPHLIKIFRKFKPHVVSHHAAQVSVAQSLKEPLKDIETNVCGTLNVCEACKKTNVKELVFASSVAVYGDCEKLPIKENYPLNPISIYGIGKYTAEMYIKLYKEWFAAAIFRYSNVYGPRQDGSSEGGVVAIFAQAQEKGEKSVIYGDGKQTRDFVNVSDVALASYQAVLKKTSNIYNISTNKETSILELYKAFQKISGTNKKPIFKLKRQGDICHSVLNNVKARNKLEWEPETELTAGLLETLEYFRNTK